MRWFRKPSLNGPHVIEPIRRITCWCDCGDFRECMDGSFLEQWKIAHSACGRPYAVYYKDYQRSMALMTLETLRVLAS